MTLLHVYLLGCLLSYIFIKYFTESGKKNTWGNIKNRFIFALFSWISIILVLIIAIIEYLYNLFTKPFWDELWNKEGPKFL